jgi:membrane-associated protease RseP (regulator of RpoE activity)
MSDKYSTSPISQEILKPVSRIGVRDQKYFLHGFLFAVTILSTLFWGAYMMLAHEYTMQMIANHASPKIIDEFSFFRQVWQNPALLYKGVAYSFAIMLVLFSHEMGHYLACCYYGINATLPFFLPAPIMTGTFGAFIKIRSPFPNRRSLFDVGLAGPIAGFVVMIPFLYFGVKWSIQVPPSMINADTIQFGDPLIFQIFSHFMMKPNMETYIHPMAFAAWFACLATSLNLLPIAQLDGGHVSYALFGKRAHIITWVFFFGVLGLSIHGFLISRTAGIQWLVYTAMLLVLKKIAGFRHPPTMDEELPIGFARKVWGVIALIVFILTFMPVTIFS